MQRTWTNRRRIIVFSIIAVAILGFTIFIDQWSKVYFKDLFSQNGKTTVINDFFYLTYTVNTGAAWSFLSDVSWGQIFFKVLTSVAIVLFFIFYIYALKKNYKWLQVSVCLVLGGTIGNFIDRVRFGGVTDFLSFVFGDYHFPVFNFADSFLVVGVVMIIIHYLFLDGSAVFKKKNGRKEVSNNGE